MLPEQDYLASLPRKRVSAALLLLNKRAELLIVKPSYRAHWLIPGGVVEPFEAPRAAAAREALEEIGLALTPGRLLAIDHVRRHDPADECLHFIFDGGVLGPAEQAAIRLAAGEIEACRFVAVTALGLVEPALARRLCQAHGARAEGAGCRYLEHGEPLG